MPDVLETPVGGLAEELAGVPIPTDAIKAIGGPYGLIGQMVSPCSDALARPPLIARLNAMGCSGSEALAEIDKMCRLMRKAKAKLRATSVGQRK